jgi:hypothetical protein
VISITIERDFPGRKMQPLPFPEIGLERYDSMP